MITIESVIYHFDPTTVNQTLGCDRCRGNRKEYCDCNKFIRTDNKQAAVQILERCKALDMKCLACGDGCPPETPGCDHPFGCGQWQELCEVAFGRCEKCKCYPLDSEGVCRSCRMDEDEVKVPSREEEREDLMTSLLDQTVRVVHSDVEQQQILGNRASKEDLNRSAINDLVEEIKSVLLYRILGEDS